MKNFLFILFIFLVNFGGLNAQESEPFRNIWINVYETEKEYKKLQDEIRDIERKIKLESDLKKMAEYNATLTLLEYRLSAYKEVPKSFADILDFPLPNVEKMNLNMISYFTKSFDRELMRNTEKVFALKAEYEKALGYLDDMIVKENDELKKNELENDRKYLSKADDLISQKLRAIYTIETFLETKKEIYRQEDLYIIISSAIIIVIAAIILYLIRRAIRRYVSDAEISAFWIRIINLITTISVVFLMIFLYVDNVLYALTFIGFIAAGFTIVMKEVILNLAAWIKLSFTNMINVGDRILVVDNRVVIGDVIDISPMSLTLYENITHNSATELKRAGRIIFIPTNMIFTKVFYNYTHDTMKTLYDLIEIPFALDSDFEKIKSITEETVISQTGRYIDMAKLQYSRLRDKYTMRSKKMRPKIQFMLQEDGKAIRMYLWYVSPYRDILNVRSNLTLELLRRYKEDNSIKLFGEKDS
ncbi:MAG: mechanosensitive ion channel [Helicobacteraceae bacterium]|jgi:small-conductance mechanosensitive channel|nr:mechanosensitive ion channel [Helicobacteraceae bacterium]